MGISQVNEENCLIKTEAGIDGCKNSDETVVGTYFHGIFHNDDLREALLNEIRHRKGLAPIYDRISFNQLREEAFDKLADHIRAHVKMEVIEQKMQEYQTRGIVKK